MLLRDSRSHLPQLKLRLREVPRERQRPLQSQLPERRELLQQRRQTPVLARALIRSSSIPLTNQPAERRLPRSQLQLLPLPLLLLPRSQPLVARSKPQPCHPQAASSQPRQLTRCQWLSSRDTSTGTRSSREANPHQVARFWAKEALARPQLPQAKPQRPQRNQRSDTDYFIFASLYS